MTGLASRTHEFSQEIQNGVGKKTLKAFQKGTIPFNKVLEYYHRNKKEADSFTGFGYMKTELVRLQKETHNPILKEKIDALINLKQELELKSTLQNIDSLSILEDMNQNALGMGLRKIISRMKKAAKRVDDWDFDIILTLLETEFANLSAKRLLSKDKKGAYRRKDYLLDKLSWMAEGSGWKYGYNEATGKNASYLVYFYLPNGEQLSWHSNNFAIRQYYPYISDVWDGQKCMTLKKLISYIGEHYGEIIGYKPICEAEAA